MQLERMARRQRHQRSGPDHRGAEQVTFLDVKQYFGLGHVRVGRWVSSEESLIAANLVFDSLADLAMVLKLPPSEIGLSQRLNLAYGHGGREGVMAHYAPMERTLALAKHAGFGALAHEYWHALDHHLADTAFDNNRAEAASGLFASENWLKEIPLRQHPLNDCLNNLFRQVLLADDGEQPHDYVQRAVELDRRAGRLYFAHPSELMARAFEAVIENQGTYEAVDEESGEILLRPLVNPFLVCGTGASTHYLVNVNPAHAPQTPAWGAMPDGAFPDARHLAAIAKPLFDYFSFLAQALCRRLAAKPKP